MSQDNSGWVMVPRVPTRAMEEAFFDANAKAKTIFAGVPEIWSAMLTAAPAPAAERQEGVTKSERNVIEALLTLAYAAWNLADNSETTDDGHLVDHAEYDAVSDALDVLDALPDDQPGYTMGEAAKARWALRGLLSAKDAAPAPVLTQAMLDAGTCAMLEFRKSGDDWTAKPAHAARAVLEAAFKAAPAPVVANERMATPRRMAAVEGLISLGYEWDGEAWGAPASAPAVGDAVEWQLCQDCDFSGQFVDWVRITRQEYERLAKIFGDREVVRLGRASLDDSTLVERADGWAHKIRALSIAARAEVSP